MKINLKKLDTNYLNYCILINLQVRRHGSQLEKDGLCYPGW